MTATERVETWFIESAHPELRKLVIHQFCHGRSTGEVLRCLQTNAGFPHSRDTLEIWKRTVLRRERCAQPKASPVEQPDPVTESIAEHRAKFDKRELHAELRQLTRLEARKRELHELLRDLLPTLETPELVETPRGQGRPQHSLVLVLSDWHVGQLTRLEETGGLFEQTPEVTRWQVEKLWQTFARLHQIYREAKDVRKLYILVLGDIIDGDQMRPSQAMKVSMPVTKQTVQAADLLSALVQRCLSIIPEIEVHLVGGNHGRTSQKAGDAGLGELAYIDTYDYLMGAMLERRYETEPRVRVVNHETFYGAAVIEGRRFVFEHGSSIRTSSGSYGGIPFYPLVNAATKFNQMLGGVDYMVIGHWHTPAMLPMQGGRSFLIMNGSLPPSSTYVQSALKVVGRPTQLLLDVHRTYGVVSWHPIYLDTPEMIGSAEFWQRVAEGAA